MARTIIIFEIENPGDLDHVGFRNWMIQQLRRLTGHVQGLSTGLGLVKTRYAATAIDPATDPSDEQIAEMIMTQLVPELVRQQLTPIQHQRKRG